jgi:hypothetical protein
MNNRSRTPNPWTIPVILGVGLLLAACSGTVPVRSPLAQPPLVERAPMTVAIRYAEDLRHHKCLVHKGYIAETWTIELGQPSMDMFKRIFSALFDKTFTVGPGLNGQSAERQAPLIEVRLLDYDGCEASWPIVGTANIGVAYEATLRDKGGAQIARWQGRGRAGAADYAAGTPDSGTGLGVEALYLSTVTRLAMRKAAADFIIRYEQDPGIRAWLGK